MIIAQLFARWTKKKKKKDPAQKWWFVSNCLHVDHVTETFHFIIWLWLYFNESSKYSKQISVHLKNMLCQKCIFKIFQILLHIYKCLKLKENGCFISTQGWFTGRWTFTLTVSSLQQSPAWLLCTGTRMTRHPDCQELPVSVWFPLLFTAHLNKSRTESLHHMCSCATFYFGSWHGSRRQTSANKVSDHLMTDHQWHQRRENSGLIWALIFVSWPWKVSRTSVSAAASAATITREENCCY